MKKKVSQLSILNEGTEAWNRWRREHPEEEIEISDSYVDTKDLSGINLKNAKLKKLDLRFSNLKNANMIGATIESCLLDKSDFSGSHLRQARFEECDLPNTNFIRSSFEETLFYRCNLKNSDLSKSKMKESDFSKSDLSQANLENSDLSFSHFFDATLLQANLKNADLSHAFLCSADFDHANLSQAKLIGSNLDGASFRCSNLQGADLQGAILIGADLSAANLCNANLTETNLHNSNLNTTCLKNAILWETILSNLDLSKVDGLTECHHLGPSIIDHRSLTRSQNLPHEFLIGIGLPNVLIRNLTALRNASSQRCSCFIYHSKLDEGFADRIRLDLQKNGIRCWNITEDASVSDRIRWQVKSRQDKLILIISSNLSLEPRIKKDFDLMQENEKSGSKFLFPVIIEKSLYDSEDGWIKLIRSSDSFIDLSEWSDKNSCQKSIKDLIDLIKKSFR